MQSKPFLTIDEAADLLRLSVRAIHERTRPGNRTIPFRKMAHTRKLLFVESELRAFMDGADLETIEKADGSVIVRPVQAVAA